MGMTKKLFSARALAREKEIPWGKGMNLSFEKAYDLVTDHEQFLAHLSEVAISIGAKDYAAGWASDAMVESMFAISAEWPAHMIQRYHLEFASQDPWTVAMIQKGSSDGSFVIMDDLVLTKVFDRSLLRNELLLPEGEDLLHGIANSVQLSNGGRGGVTFYRGAKQKPFSAEERARLNATSRDMTRLINLKAQLHSQQMISKDWRSLVDTFTFPVFVIDLNRKIVASNETAERILQMERGLICRNGSLSAALPERANALVEICSAVAHGQIDDVTSFSVQCGDILRHFTVLVPPNPGGGKRILLIDDRAKRLSASTVQLLRARYRLSPAEAEIICAMAEGHSPKELCEIRSVGLETIRTQYRSAIHKMDCRDLTDAVIQVRQAPDIICDK